MAQLKVIKQVFPRTIEDRLRDVLNKHGDIMDTECTDIVVLAFTEDNVLTLSDRVISYTELDHMLFEAQRVLFIDGIVRTLQSLQD